MKWAFVAASVKDVKFRMAPPNVSVIWPAQGNYHQCVPLIIRRTPTSVSWRLQNARVVRASELLDQGVAVSSGREGNMTCKKVRALCLSPSTRALIYFPLHFIHSSKQMYRETCIVSRTCSGTQLGIVEI